MRLVLAVLLVLLAAGCGEDPAAEPPATGEDPGNDAQDAGEVADDVLEGALGGDPQLEGGCAWLDTGDQRYEVFYPEGYRITFEPLRLMGPDGETVAEEGDPVRVRGRVADDMVSVCQVGTLYQADEVLD